MQIDDTDRRLLRRLLAEPNLSLSDLADLAGVTPATASRRLDRLTRAEVITAQRAVIDWSKLGYGVEVSLRFTLDKTDARAFDEFIAAARDVPEVTQIQTFLGKVDVRLHVIARDMSHYQEIYRSRILTLPHIAEIEALMQVASIMEVEALPL
ncbi:Lrp/AsnC family transcriptional regulator [Maritimibacter dapengensis]|uniref:Lrp/AsnC family transcriptional regulator n=1 Tax=Maritimibacter dapengensis TaxID=2836868 RepID=A0ABS6SYD1_9RHOB|nr:Lrp/AsnC family transcriptional regulator [Maritimibacter dapengensis]MBV7377930.1 Lrp/AsnC family transcriptional regulator [Maritimibacter dapengensis]